MPSAKRSSLTGRSQSSAINVGPQTQTKPAESRFFVWKRSLKPFVDHRGFWLGIKSKDAASEILCRNNIETWYFIAFVEFLSYSASCRAIAMSQVKHRNPTPYLLSYPIFNSISCFFLKFFADSFLCLTIVILDHSFSFLFFWFASEILLRFRAFSMLNWKIFWIEISGIQFFVIIGVSGKLGFSFSSKIWYSDCPRFSFRRKVSFFFFPSLEFINFGCNGCLNIFIPLSIPFFFFLFFSFLLIWSLDTILVIFWNYHSGIIYFIFIAWKPLD